MKNIILAQLAFITYSVSFAHDIIVPHTHNSEMNYLEILGYVALPLVVIFAAIKLVKYLRYKRA